MNEPEILPYTRLPISPLMETPSLDIPVGKLPYHNPIVVPPSDLERPKNTQPETTEQQEPPSLTIPVIDIPVPLPTTEVVMAATYAAVSAVAVTTFAQPLFDSIKKKVQKQLQAKVNKWKEQRKSKKKDSSES